MLPEGVRGEGQGSSVGEEAVGQWAARLRAGSVSGPEHNKALLEQFYVTLRVIRHAARHEGVGADAIRQEIDALFELPPAWRVAYEIEQLLTLVMTPAQLDADLERRLEELRSKEMPFVELYAGQYERIRPTSEDEPRRVLLQRLLNDSQWFYEQRINRRSAARKLSSRISVLFLSVFVIFFLVMGIQFFAQQRGPGGRVVAVELPGVDAVSAGPPKSAPEALTTEE